MPEGGEILGKRQFTAVQDRFLQPAFHSGPTRDFVHGPVDLPAFFDLTDEVGIGPGPLQQACRPVSGRSRAGSGDDEQDREEVVFHRIEGLSARTRFHPRLGQGAVQGLIDRTAEVAGFIVSVVGPVHGALEAFLEGEQGLDTE